jgi:hypothetical protein
MMTISDPMARKRRKAAPAAAVASLVGSVAVHTAFAVAAAGIAWQLSQDPPVLSREVVITFEDVAGTEGDESAIAPTAHEPAATKEPSLHPQRPSFEPVAPHRTTVAAQALAAAAELPPSLLSAPRRNDEDSGASEKATIEPAFGVTAASESDSAGVRFAGLGASNARSVVYIVDASGPMVTSMPRVVSELRRSVEQLAPSQKFGVVLFRRTDSGSGTEVFAPVLMRATPTAKRRLVEWLADIRPIGASNPLTGLEAALKLKPDAAFLLSRSIVRSGGGVWDDGLETTLARLDELNPPITVDGRRATLIQTIQFLDDDPTGIMQAIGARHGQGAGYRVIRRSEDIAGQTR